MFQSHVYNMYVSACDHSDTYKKCAHVSCGVIINGKLEYISQNTPSTHAEMGSLIWLYQKEYWEKRFYYRFNRASCS